MTSRSDVMEMYRALLDREPESDEVVDAQVQAHENRASLRQAILASGEFQARNPVATAWAPPYYHHFESQVDMSTSREQLDQLFAKVSDGWTKLGAAEPHWSVLNDRKYEQVAISENMDGFYASGFDDKRGLDAFCSRNSIRYRKGVCVELGCGVGRITSALASSFERVVALDVSPNNLAVCERHLKDHKIANVELRLVKTIQEFQSLPEFDVFFSLITLQHNPPPVQHFILDTILDKGSQGAISFFQTPHYWSNYSYSSASYLRKGLKLLKRSLADHMEMHPLPMRFVNESLTRAGYKLIEVSQDNCTGHPGSFTYFSQRQ